MIIDFISDSFKGIQNKTNKDSLMFLKEGGNYLFIVFDGVSSAINAKKGIGLSKSFIKKNWIKYIKRDSLSLKNLMHDVNTFITKKGLKDIYTTYSALFINEKNNGVVISNLGDSRIYGISKQYYITRYSKDDRLILSNTITKCLGMIDLEKKDFQDFKIDKPERRILLCSDGFYSFLENEKLSFFYLLNLKSLNVVKKNIKKELFKKNIDDATYILINLYV